MKKYLVNRLLIGLGFILLVIAGIATHFYLRNFDAQEQKEIVAQPTQKYVVALGRVEPEGEIIQLSAPTSFEGSRLRVAQLLVKKGDVIEQGQLIAILDNYERLTANLERAKKQLEVARAKLLQVKAGNSEGKIAAQRAIINQLKVELKEAEAAFIAKITRLKAELSNAEEDYQRYYRLYQEGAIPASEIDSRQLAVKTASAQLNEGIATSNRTLGKLKEQIQEAKENLKDIKEVRAVDVQVMQSEVDSALAAVTQAEANLNVALVRSPQTGQVLDIFTRPGELVKEQGIIEIGQTNQMYAVAEVYETDITRVKIGAKAIITSACLTEELQGTVSQIGLKIDKKDILDTDPVANEDARIVETKIRLAPLDSQMVSGLTNLRVKVKIFTSETE